MQIPPARIEYLDAVILQFNHIDIAGRINRDIKGVIKLVRLKPVTADSSKILACRGEFFNRVRAVLGDINIVMHIGCDTHRIVQAGVA